MDEDVKSRQQNRRRDERGLEVKAEKKRHDFLGSLQLEEELDDRYKKLAAFTRAVSGVERERRR